MTKWSRIRRRKERRRAEAEERQRNQLQDNQPNTQQETVSENIRLAKEKEKAEHAQTQNSKLILLQIPRYAYLLAFFALLAGVFYPLITDNPEEQTFDNLLKGTAILFLGLAGAILVYKGTTGNKKRSTFVSFGLSMIAVSLALIFTIASAPS